MRTTERLRAGGMGSQRRNAHGVSALAQTQLPEAARAVHSLLRDDHCDAQARAQAFVSMGLETLNPPMEAVDELIRIGRTRSEYPGAEQMATTNLGAMASLQRARHPEITAKIVADIGDRLDHDTGDPLFNALMGASNTNEKSLLPKVEAHLQDKATEPRAAAWSALTGMPYEAVLARFDALLLLAQANQMEHRLFEALANGAQQSQSAPPANVMEAVLALYPKVSPEHSTMPLHLTQLIAAAWAKSPNDAILLAAMRAKFQEALKGQHKQMMQQLVAIAGLNTLMAP